MAATDAHQILPRVLPRLVGDLLFEECAPMRVHRVSYARVSHASARTRARVRASVRASARRQAIVEAQKAGSLSDLRSQLDLCGNRDDEALEIINRVGGVRCRQRQIACEVQSREEEAWWARCR
eukprot:6204482-Pleurochrysis_carterae.AAC.2